MDYFFFNLLSEDNIFCKELMRMTLAAGKLESELKEYLRMYSITFNNKSVTFGSIINLLYNNKLLSENGKKVMGVLKARRNYLTHCLYDLFSERINETILPNSKLIPEDVSNITENVEELSCDLNNMSKLVELKIRTIKHTKLSLSNPILVITP